MKNKTTYYLCCSDLDCSHLSPLCHPELRSFIQTLLDLLQRAEDYIRDKVDLTFFTQTLPQLVEHIYSTAFIHTRERRDLALSPRLTQMKGTSFLDCLIPFDLRIKSINNLQEAMHIQLYTCLFRCINIIRHWVLKSGF